MGQFNKSLIPFIFWSLFCFGLTLSKFFISVGFIGLVVFGLFNLNKYALSNSERKISFVLVLSFVITLISIVYFQNIGLSLDKLVLKLPLLFFPFIIFAFKSVSNSMRFKMVLVFNYALFLPSVVSVYNYLINKVLFDDLILQSKPLPIEFGYGIYHIQFSVLLAAAIVLGISTLMLMRNRVNKYDKWFLIILVSINIFCIHVLSARTGLFGLYMAIIILVYYYFKRVELKKRLIMGVILVVLPTLLILFSTSLRHRLVNTVEDFKVTISGKDANDYSMAMRVAAWFNAFDVIKKNPILGVGVGNVENELKENFTTYNPSILPQNRKNPHNQFIETAVESGVFNGLLLVLFFGMMFLLKFDNRLKYKLMALGILFFSACLFESILERQATVVGVVLILAFALSKEADEPEKMLT